MQDLINLKRKKYFKPDHYNSCQRPNRRTDQTASSCMHEIDFAELELTGL